MLKIALESLIILVAVWVLYAGVWAVVKVRQPLDWTIVVAITVIFTILLGVFRCLA